MQAREIRPLLLASAAVLAVAPALAQGYDPPNSLDWPLYNQFAPTEARQGLGNTFGEYQSYVSGDYYLHTGIDIRGQAGDIVRVVASGNVWVTANVSDDGCTHDSYCRLYVQGDDGYIYYYSHLGLGPEAEEMTSEVRDKIVNATRFDAAGGTYPVQPDTHINVGQILSEIGLFGGGDGWHHLHFGIVDPSENYDALHPLTALKRTGFGPAIIDDEPPVIGDLRLFVDGTTTPVPIPDACTPIDGTVDIAATMSDTFFTSDPAPAAVSGSAVWSIGVYEAEYRVRNIGTNALITGTWYRFDRAPLRCAGPLRGNDCPVVLGQSGFFEESFEQSHAGLNMGSPYANVLFASSLSSSNYAGTETYVHLLTHEWGEPGAWNTAASGNGWYQISAVARDADGNQAALSRFVTVNNGGNAMLPADAYVRDNPVDVGALPSTLGGQPFWTSPDIFIVPQGTAVGEGDTPPNTLLEAGTTYDVYIRVHNDSCETVHGLKTQVYSANPAMIVDDSEWVWITPEDSWVPMMNVNIAPGEVELLGPFEWTPTAAEAGSNEGHRCMLAKIDANNDPFGGDSVANDNNYAQRNLQFDLTSFSFNNPSKKSAKIETELACNGFPIHAKGAWVELRIAYHPAIFQAWQNAPGTIVTQAGGEIIIRFTQCNVKLPAVGLPGSTALKASFDAVLPSGTPGKYVLDLSQRLNGVLGGGMSFESRTQ